MFYSDQLAQEFISGIMAMHQHPAGAVLTLPMTAFLMLQQKRIIIHIYITHQHQHDQIAGFCLSSLFQYF